MLPGGRRRIWERETTLEPTRSPEAARSERRRQKGHLATTYAMLTFQEFLAKKAMVLPNLFRIEPFIGLDPVPLKPTPKPRHRLGGGEKPRHPQARYFSARTRNNVLLHSSNHR